MTLRRKTLKHSYKGQRWWLQLYLYYCQSKLSSEETLNPEYKEEISKNKDANQEWYTSWIHYKCTRVKKTLFWNISSTGGRALYLLHSTEHARADGTEHTNHWNGNMWIVTTADGSYRPMVTASMLLKNSEVPWPCVDWHEGWWSSLPRGLGSCNSLGHPVSSKKHDVPTVQSAS